MRKLSLVLSAFGLLFSSLLTAAPQISAKHIYVLYPGVDSIFGSYIFMVQNAGAQPERFSFPVMLPVETIDFQAQEGIAPTELNLGTDRGLTIDKTFPPGDTLITIGFKTASNVGTSKLTLKANTPFESVGLFVFEGKFEMEGPNLVVQRGKEFSGRIYDTYTLSNGEAGKTYEMTVTGIPEGRGRLWYIGWIFAGILLIVAVSLAYVSRPKLPQGADEII